MTDRDVLARLSAEVYHELRDRVLPFWVERTLDEAHGGFVGRIRQDGVRVAEAPKGAVLNARILWTFAAAYRFLGHDAYRCLAERAYVYLEAHFWDPDHEGIYWSLDPLGAPYETRKQTYAQAFALYGYAEYHRATGNDGALARSIALFRLIEARAHDPVHGGYLEAFGRDWSVLDDVRLSAKDLNAPKSMNTHLHVLEAYTNLFRVWKDPLLRARLTALVELFLARILDPQTHHLHLFADVDWTPCAQIVSFGHDIEASWLLLEATDVLEDPALRGRVREAAVAMARVTRCHGQDADGGLFYEVAPDGHLDADKHWWPQAEAVVGFLNAYRETGERDFLDAAVAAWGFIGRYLFDRVGGEWFGRVSRDGVPYEGEDKVGLWKCPYHNARTCFEVILRAEAAGVPRPDRGTG